MVIRSQNEKILVATDYVVNLYIIDNTIMVGFADASDMDIGKYGSEERCREVVNEIFTGLAEDAKSYRMPAR